MKREFCLILFLTFVCMSYSQKKKGKPFSSFAENVIRKYTDSLTQVKTYYDTQWRYEKEDLLNNPYYYRLFLHPTLYYSPVKQVMDSRWVGKYNRLKHSTKAMNLSDSNLALDSTMNDFFMDMYVSYPELIDQDESSFDKEGGLRDNLVTKIDHEVSLADKVKPNEPVEVIEPVHVVSHRPNFWSFQHDYSMRFMQNYLSSNWYQGGESNYSMLASATFQANYDNKQKVLWENKLEMRLGFQSSRSDTVHQFKTNDDLIRMTNKLGLRAFKNWYYTFSLLSWTQFYPQYGTNSQKVWSDFMSPFESVFSIGMEYKLNAKNFSLSANVAPLSYDLKYVNRRLLETRFGNKPNHHLREYYGSNLTINCSYRIMKELSWSCRAYYKTNYKSVQIEWENTFNFKINQYLSTDLYLYPRFDDSVKREKDESLIQFKEYLSLRFNYSF